MEATAKPFMKLFQRALAATVVTKKPLLPMYVQDVDPPERPSGPPSPCEEIVIIGRDGFRVDIVRVAASPSTATAATMAAPAFKVDNIV